MNLKIIHKIGVLFFILTSLSMILGVVAYKGFNSYQKATEDMQLAAQRARYGDQINGLVYAVVMDSRGLYMAQDMTEVEKFSKPLLENLKRIEEKVNKLEEIAEPSTKDKISDLKNAANNFVMFRTETIRQARDGGGPAARAYGDNEQNRENRKAFNKALLEFADHNNADIEKRSVDAITYHKSSIKLIIILIILGGGGSVATAFITLRRSVAKPLDNIDQYLNTLAKGDLSKEVPFQDRLDEIGTMAKSIAKLREGLLREAVLTKKAEEQRSIDAYFRGQIDAINRSQAVIEFDTEGNIITANDHFLIAMGYSLEEIVDKHHSVFIDTEYASTNEYKIFWEKMRKGEYQTGEYKRIGKNGREVWIRASYNPILNEKGEVFRVVKFAVETTKEKLANADFQGQIEAINKSQAVIHFNMDGTIIQANDIFLNAMGYLAEEVINKHHRMFVDKNEAQSKEYIEFWDLLRSGNFDARVFKRITKSGREIWIQASYNPIFDMNGKPFKVVKYATDVTEMINLTDETGTNVQSVAAATEELSASIAEISSSMARSKDATDDIVAKTHISSNASRDLVENMRQMEEIVSLIKNIADQVNLLALNATIEAARAGDAGKGFAVVANEVKNLANQTAAATDDIVKEISSVQNISKEVANSVSDIIQSANAVNNYVSAVAGAIEEQSAIIKEISANSQSTSDAVIMISDKIKNKRA